MRAGRLREVHLLHQHGRHQHGGDDCSKSTAEPDVADDMSTPQRCAKEHQGKGPRGRHVNVCHHRRTLQRVLHLHALEPLLPKIGELQRVACKQGERRRTHHDGDGDEEREEGECNNGKPDDAD